MATKKSFKADMAQQSTVAASYISAPPAAEDEKELKTKRLNLLIKPTVHERIEKIAVMQRKSVNELVNNVLEAYAEDKANLVAKYNATFNEEG